MFCENCGLQFFPRQSVCTRCQATCTRHWFQLTSLTTLLVAAACNSLAFFLLPLWAVVHSAPAALRQSPRISPDLKAPAIHAWIWIGARVSFYGWAPLALGLLTWDYFAWPDSRPMLKERIKRWIVRVLLVFAFVEQLVPLIPLWIRPPAALLGIAAKLPPFPATIKPSLSALLPWAIVSFAVALLCINAETRDELLGRGRVLSAVSLGVLVTVLTFTLWAVAP